MKFKRDYLGYFPENGLNNLLAFQLAVESAYLIEEFDRSLPHHMHHDAAMVKGRYQRASRKNWLRVNEATEAILSEKEIPFEDFHACKRELHKYTHRKVTECYKKYEGNYLLEGICIEVEDDSDD